MSLAQDFNHFVERYQSGKSAQAATEETRSSRRYYGVRNPDMHVFLKQWSSENTLTYDQWLAEMQQLYNGSSVEECCFAGIVLAKYSKFRQQLPLNTLDKWLGQLEGWQEVDTTCQSTFTAKELLANWDEWEKLLISLANDDNINKRRASLVLLVMPIRKTPDTRLLDIGLSNIGKLKHEKNTMITKAVSWLLRSAINQHQAAIEDYVDKNEETLPAIAVRETRNKLITGKK